MGMGPSRGIFGRLFGRDTQGVPISRVEYQSAKPNVYAQKEISGTQPAYQYIPALNEINPYAQAYLNYLNQIAPPVMQQTPATPSFAGPTGLAAIAQMYGIPMPTTSTNQAAPTTATSSAPSASK